MGGIRNEVERGGLTGGEGDKEWGRMEWTEWVGKKWDINGMDNIKWERECSLEWVISTSVNVMG